MSDHGSSSKAILYAFLANLGIAVTKSAAAIYTNSGSMLAEAIHSYADCANQVLLFLGLRQAGKPPTPEHPFGFGKETYFWSFVVALLLFSLGGLFSIYEGWHKLHEPEALNRAWIALSVLAVAIVLETASLARLPEGDREAASRPPASATGCATHVMPSSWSCSARTSPRLRASRSLSPSSPSRPPPVTRVTTRSARSRSVPC